MSKTNESPYFKKPEQIKKEFNDIHVELKPCDRCIKNLREKLFKIKTYCGMIPYKTGIEIAKNFMYDLYTTNIINERNKNIEHVVPAVIFRNRENINREKLDIDKEPYHDMHIYFPTNRDINTLRANYIYGNIANSRTEALLNKNITKIINNDAILDKTNEYGVDGLKKIDEHMINKYDDKLDIYIDDGNSIKKEKSIINNNKRYFKQYRVCDIGRCIFQPSKEFSGDIARIVFYFYLMYAYESKVRPYTKTVPWFNYTVNFRDGSKYDTFQFEKWKVFFIDHINDYYKWAKNDGISFEENMRNIGIIDNTGVPNIFVGYRNIKGRYINSSFDIIDELLFGKEHNHEKYETMEFDEDKKICANDYYLNYSDEYNER